VGLREPGRRPVDRGPAAVEQLAIVGHVKISSAQPQINELEPQRDIIY